LDHPAVIEAVGIEITVAEAVNLGYGVFLRPKDFEDADDVGFIPLDGREVAHYDRPSWLELVRHR
jgi:hypothetical protein